ncbi:hypothetical protein [Kribbella sindirgiensis]|uniref:hypothetical protein n=1 Tax=Kribbella sindirgiensis TaxID=1124744 RepID=UPI001EDCA4CF|nr:hypothetical protein [Kribbella sindirgiensis]
MVNQIDDEPPHMPEPAVAVVLHKAACAAALGSKATAPGATWIEAPGFAPFDQPRPRTDRRTLPR